MFSYAMYQPHADEALSTTSVFKVPEAAVGERVSPGAARVR